MSDVTKDRDVLDLFSEAELNEMWPDFMYDLYGYPGEYEVVPFEAQGQTFAEMREENARGGK